MTPLFAGILYGLVLMLFTGPAFFFMISIGITRGFKAAAFFAIGIFASDFAIICGVFLGLSDLFTNILFQELFSIIGGVLLLLLGIKFFTKKYEPDVKEIDLKKKDWTYIIQAFMLNILNPGVFALWIVIVSNASTFVTNSNGPEYLNTGYLLYLGGVIGTVFTTDLLKAAFANRIGKILKPKVINTTYKILGILFGLASIKLIYDFFVLFFYGQQA